MNQFTGERLPLFLLIYQFKLIETVKVIGLNVLMLVRVLLIENGPKLKLNLA
jgi:hypothetical protein